MKKFIFTTATLLSAVGIVFAQTATDQVTLNVKLNPIQTIEVNSVQKTVDLEYTSIADYAGGVSSTQQDHLKVYSTGAFAVTVKSDADDIVRANGSETLSASTLKVKAENGSTNALIGATLGEVSLSTTATNIISSGVGGVGKNFNITYSGMGSDAYVNKYFNDENPTVYTTVLTYAIIAQ